MVRRALLIGGVVLAARLLTFPRTPWDAEELRFPFALMVGISIAASVVTAVVMALREPVAALLFSFSAAVMVHGVTATTDALSWMFLVVAWFSGPPPSWRLWRRRPACADGGGTPPPQPAEMAAVRIAALLLAVVTFPFTGIPEELPLPHDFSIARFTLHPWGSKLVFLPLLAAVAFGVRPVLKRKELEPMAWFTLVHLAIGIAVVDPREGVRYAIPAMILVAIVAAEGLQALRVRWVGAGVIAALSIAYVYPLLHERVTTASPLARAMRAQAPGSEVVEGKEGNLVFSRSAADPWGKLTRNAYRHASVVPVEPFAPGVGVYGVERNEARERWRWLEKYAELRAPGPVRLTLRLPPEAKIDANEVRVNGLPVRVARGESVTVHAPARVAVEALREFPLDPPDTRRVAVQLVRVER